MLAARRLGAVTSFGIRCTICAIRTPSFAAAPARAVGAAPARAMAAPPAEPAPAARAGRRGAFVLFEGVDRCGKTTQATKLVEALNASGERAVLMRFPGERIHPGRVCDGAGGSTRVFDTRLGKKHLPVAFRTADRTTPTGIIINKYLTKEIDLDDRAVHLLFSANRWERV
jgi:hypothetical protein